jgi:hypothetical protein
MMRSERLFNLVVWVFIAAVGLATAYICFGILSSQANGRFQQYNVGGAIAGALVSWTVLTMVYLQLRKSSNELESLRRQNKELQSKLIRGAPCPNGFDIEVDERQRIVLARPKAWVPKGGMIFQLELPEERMKPNDNFAAAFTCSFVPIEKDSKQTWDQFHQSQIDLYEENSRNGFVESYNEEAMRVGGDAAGVKSLKLVARMAAKVEWKPDPVTQRTKRNWSPVLWTEFVGWIYEVIPAEIAAGSPTTITIRGNDFRANAICHVNRQKRETRIIDANTAEVKLETSDVEEPGLLELSIENPETHGKRSDPVRLKVLAPEGERLASPAITADQERSEIAPAAAAAENLNLGVLKHHEEGEGSTVKALTENPKKEEIRVAYLEVVNMTVFCYQEALEKIFYFDFWDDSKDFVESSDDFNLILASTRFLS